MSAKKQGIDHKSGAPAPCSDLTRAKPISPRSNRGERNDRGLRRERFPGGTQKTPALSIDRYGTGESDDSLGREKDERGDIAVANQMHERPEADPGQERVTGDPNDAARRLREAPFLADRGRVWRRQANDDQQRGREHEGDREGLPPFEHSPGGEIGGAIISGHEPREPDHGSEREGDPITVLSHCRDRPIADRGTGNTEMYSGEENCGKH